MLLPDRSLVDDGRLPAAALAELADRESRQPQAIYKTHKWFARRLGTSMRALTVGLACGDDETFWEMFHGAPDFCGTLLDPFVGGGTTITEASRLGMSVMGVDIDPVAVAITEFQMGLADSPSVVATLNQLIRDVGSTLAPLHRVQTARRRSLVAVHHFWVQEHFCRSCRTAFDLHPTHEIGRTPALGTRAVVCSSCGSVGTTSISSSHFDCTCGARTVICDGHVRYGVAICPSCGHREAVIDAARRTRTPPQFRLFAHEVFDPDQTPRPTLAQRWFIAADPRSEELLAECDYILETEGDVLPRASIGKNDRDGRLAAYNRTELAYLFNARQRLHLARLLVAIEQLKGSERRAAAIAFSDHLRTNNMLCGYAAGWRRLRPLFAIRGWHHVVRPVEINPWLDGIGRGTFPNAMRRIEKARLQARRPRGALPCSSASFRHVVVRQGTSSRLSDVPDASVDVVLTDPPYFDKLNYAELADFFRPWMHRLGLLSGDADGRGGDEQLASLATKDDGGKAFSERLAACFCEAARALKPGGPLVFTYQANASGWLSLARALQPAGLEPSSVQPLLGDAGSGDHKHSGALRWDAVLCLRKPHGWTPSMARELRCDARDLEEARATVTRGERAARGGRIEFGDADRRNLMAAALCMAALGRRRRGDSRCLSDILEEACRT